MKKYIALLAGVLTLPAYANNATISREFKTVESAETNATARQSTIARTTTASRVSSNRNQTINENSTRNVASRTTPSTTNDNASSTRAIPAARTATQTISTRGATPVTTAARSTNTSRSATTVRTTNPTPGIAARSTTTSPVSIFSTASTPMTTEIPTMEDVMARSEITDFCKAQFTECMDNFCNVLDENQGRCSCSDNVESYADIELALETATEQLQMVAQEIQYIGLSADDIETLFAQTEAEAAMQGQTDTSQLASDLENIKDLILDVDSNTTFTGATSTTFDFSNLLDFSSGGIDINTLFGSGNNNDSIANQRGDQLYKTAFARCEAAVLDTCELQGVDVTFVSNSYDLEIDKQCVAYERNLTDANKNMKQTVINAQSVLQKARLAVAQDKNSYDLRGCITALDGCMQDDYVCGDDYEDCLDPTGKYIANGEVIVGSVPGKAATITDAVLGGDGLYSAWNYNSKNAWSNGTLPEYINTNVKISITGETSSDMVAYLKDKIGRNIDGKNTGMCMSVLNKCQDYTYDDSDEYVEDNEVVRNYLQATLAQIKVQQDEIMAEYAESCQMDLQSCLVRNNYDETQASNAAVNNVAKNACATIIDTCESVTGFDDGSTTNDSMLPDIVMGNLQRNCDPSSAIDTCSDGYKCGTNGICGVIQNWCANDAGCADGYICNIDSMNSNNNQCIIDPNQPQCTQASDCASIAGKTAACTANACVYTDIVGYCTSNTQCNDSDPSTSDTCNTSTNVCAFTPIVGYCTTSADCSGDNLCNRTTQRCDYVSELDINTGNECAKYSNAVEVTIANNPGCSAIPADLSNNDNICNTNADCQIGTNPNISYIPTCDTTLKICYLRI